MSDEEEEDDEALDAKVQDGEDPQPCKPDPVGDECFALLKQLQARESQDMDDWEASKQCNFDVTTLGALKSAGAKVCADLDRAELKECTTADDGIADQPMKYPYSCLCLSDLLDRPEVLQSMKDQRFFTHVWHFWVNLRAHPSGGCDRRLIKNHRACRRVSSKLNWHQMLTHASKLINSEHGMSASRVSRSAAWKMVSASMFEKLQLDPSLQPTLLAAGSIVLMLSPSKPHCWSVGLVTSLWHVGAKKKSKPTHLPIPLSKARSLRACLMTPVAKTPEDPQDCFEATSRSLMVTCSVLRVAAVLTCEKSTPHLDGLQCQLTPTSLLAVQLARKISWPKILQQDDPTPCQTFQSKASVFQASPKKKAQDAKDSKGSKGKDGKAGKTKTAGKEEGPPAAQEVETEGDKETDEKDEKGFLFRFHIGPVLSHPLYLFFYHLTCVSDTPHSY